MVYHNRKINRATFTTSKTHFGFASYDSVKKFLVREDRVIPKDFNLNLSMYTTLSLPKKIKLLFYSLQKLYIII